MRKGFLNHYNANLQAYSTSSKPLSIWGEKGQYKQTFPPMFIVLFQQSIADD